MTTIDSNFLNKQLKAEQCPIVDGVIFGDCRIKEVEAKWVRNASDRHRLRLFRRGESSLSELANQNLLQWTEITTFCEEMYNKNDLKLICGDGALGSDGFVAAIKLSKNELIWLAFFQESNPFVVVKLKAEIVWAKTDLEQWWRFPLDAPEEVSIRLNNSEGGSD